VTLRIWRKRAVDVATTPVAAGQVKVAENTVG
jgi:hypothetical protein